MHGYIILCITYTVGPLIVIEFSPHIYCVVTITLIAIVGVYTRTFRLCAHQNSPPCLRLFLFNGILTTTLLSCRAAFLPS